MNLFMFELQVWDDVRMIHLPGRIVLIVEENEEKAQATLFGNIQLKDTIDCLGQVNPLFNPESPADDSRFILDASEVCRQVQLARDTQSKYDRMHVRKVRERQS